MVVGKWHVCAGAIGCLYVQYVAVSWLRYEAATMIVCFVVVTIPMLLLGGCTDVIMVLYSTYVQGKCSLMCCCSLFQIFRYSVQDLFEYNSTDKFTYL
jgi:hypothetical protein